MKKQKQKKIIVVAAIALMIALVSGMGAMTYARYISSANVPTQQATAAKWGFVVTAEASDLFGTDYSKDGTYATIIDGEGVAVNAHADTVGDIVAPGTTGSMTIAVNGIAEVRAKVTFDFADGYTDISYTKGGNTYYPIKWSLNDGSTTTNYASLSALVTYLEGLSKDIPAGTNVSHNFTITWTWDLNDADTAEAKEASIKDTCIGFKAAGKDASALTTTFDPNGVAYSTHMTDATIVTEIKFALSITVEQIQTVTP